MFVVVANQCQSVIALIILRHGSKLDKPYI